MSTEANYKFYLRIVLPSILAMGLFIVSIFAIILPAFENTMMERKKEMISELTLAAWSILDEYQHMYAGGELSLEEAQHQAADIIELMRYGAERKDYFWIIDMRPYMVMHPYRPELNGTDLSNYQDPQGTLLFVEAVRRVKEKGEGYIQYIWQWKDDASRLVPKLSYVKGYPDWGWIIGTGIYLEDVKEEIASLRARLLRISLLIFLVIGIALFYIVRQSLGIERERKHVEQDLKLSRQKYKSLVEASTEGTIMMIRQKIIFANLKLISMLGCSSADVQNLRFDDLFEIPWRDVLEKFTDPKKSVILETRLMCGDKSQKEVIISVSRVEYGSEDGYIVVAKDVSRQKRLELGSEALSREMQMSLLLMNQPVRSFVREMIHCAPTTPVGEAAALMTRKHQDAVFIQYHTRIIGVLTDSDLRSRVLARSVPSSVPVSELMSSPIISIEEDALLYEALLLFRSESVSHLVVKDLQGEPRGVISYLDVLKVQHNTLDFTIREIEAAEEMVQLEKISSRTPALVNALLESGDKTSNITHVITSISDAISRRLIEFSLEKHGPAPCRFAFMALGSEGRGEQTLSTDQDNAIVFEDTDKENTTQAYAYFSRLAKEVNTHLNTIGYRFCKGEIMAMNPKWTQALSVWKEYFKDWLSTSDPQSILDSSIFFDLRCLYGNCDLVDQLLKHIHTESQHQATFFQHMANPIIKSKSRVGLFGGIVGDQAAGESKMIDIKKIQRPITGFARIYALKHQLEETNTLKRLEKLNSLGLLSRQLLDELTVSYSLLMQLRLRFQSQAELNNQVPDNMVDIGQLTAIELTTLKKVLSELNTMQTQLSFDFKGAL